MADVVSGQITRFLDFLAVERGLSRNTLDAYRRDLLRYGRYLLEMRVADAATAPEDVVVRGATVQHRVRRRSEVPRILGRSIAGGGAHVPSVPGP